MKTFLISYDLNKEGAQYSKAKEQIEKAIKALGDVIHCVTTTWLVKTNYTSAQVYAHIKKNTDDNDRFIITQFCNDHSGWLSQNTINWLATAPKCC